MASELLDRLDAKRQTSDTGNEWYWSAINLVKKLLSIPGCTETHDPEEDIYHLSYKDEKLLMLNFRTTEIQPCVMISLIHSYNEQDATLLENPLVGLIPAFCMLTGSPLGIAEAWWRIAIWYLMSKYPETRELLAQCHRKIIV